MAKRCSILLLLLAYAISVCPGCRTAAAPAPAVPAPLPTAATAGGATVIAVQPPAPACCPKPTLWEFLGFKGLFQAAGGGIHRIRNRLGSRFPGLEARPEILAITDPANMGPDAPPAVKAAAEAKAYEDQAAQKIKAIRYLATLGCTSCFPDVEKGLLAALEDCTEAVRYEAVLAIRDLSGGPCAQCLNNRCCSPAILKKLDQMANEMDERGCYREPSARVRRVARLALQGCGGAPAERSELPEEGPPGDLPPPGPGVPPPPPPEARQPAPQPDPAMLASAQAPLPSRPADSIVLADVNGQLIYEHEVLSGLAQRQPAGPSPLRAELERVIERKLICQAAQRAGFVAQSAASGARPASFEAAPGQPAAPVDEATLAAQWLEQRVPVSTEVSRQEVFAIYRQNVDRFQPPAEVRYELLQASAEEFGNREAATAAIRYLRDRAQGLAVSPPAGLDVSRVSTRRFDWTRRDAVRSPELAHCLFALPVGTLSPILYDGAGAYVVRVLERRQPRALSLDEAAPRITDDVIRRRRQEAQRRYVEQLRREAQIWTVFDRPLPQQTPAWGG